MDLFDSHVHLDDDAFDADRDAVLARAAAAGIAGMVTVGTSVSSSRAAVALAERHEGVFAAVAVHPHEAADATEEAMDALRALAGHPKVVAVGETGLDYARAPHGRDVQVQAFWRHILLSREADLPLIIHCREAYPEVLDILAEAGARRVIMHAFSGSPQIARRCVERGYAISLAGPVTFPHARAPIEVVTAVPVEHLLVETDAPVLAPQPVRGRRNEPAYLTHIVQRIADILQQPAAAVAAATAANARRIFGIAGAR